jgi:hypothetical protein
MDPQAVFCPNEACPASGQVGKGNISVHSQKERRYKYTVCNNNVQLFHKAAPAVVALARAT